MSIKLKVLFQYDSETQTLRAEHLDTKVFVETKVGTETVDEAKLRALKMLSEKLKEILKVEEVKKPKTSKKSKKRK